VTLIVHSKCRPSFAGCEKCLSEAYNSIGTPLQDYENLDDFLIRESGTERQYYDNEADFKASELKKDVEFLLANEQISLAEKKQPFHEMLYKKLQEDYKNLSSLYNNCHITSGNSMTYVNLSELYQFKHVFRYRLEPVHLNQYLNFSESNIVFLRSGLSSELVKELSQLELTVRTIEIKLYQPEYALGLLTNPKIVKGLYFTNSNIDSKHDVESNLLVNVPSALTFRRLTLEASDARKDRPHSPPSRYFLPNSFVNPFTWSGVYLFPFNENESKTSLNNGDVYFVDITIRKEYPFLPPEFVFLNTMFHPNIDKNGRIRTRRLTNHFTPALSIRRLFEDVNDKLMSPELQ